MGHEEARRDLGMASTLAAPGSPSVGSTTVVTTATAVASSPAAAGATSSASVVAATATPPPTSKMTSLVSIATRSAALYARVDELLAVVEYFPASIRAELFTYLSAARLRELELAWKRVHQAPVETATQSVAADEEEARHDEQDWPFECESQIAWHARWEAVSSGSGPVRGNGIYHDDRPGASLASARERDYRQLFWERHVRALLKARTNALDASADVSGAMPESDAGVASTSDTAAAGSEGSDTNVHLFADVVRSLRVHGREVRALNMPLITALRRLERLEVHHPEQQRTCWSSLLGLLAAIPTLRELGFFHGKLTDVQIAKIRRTLCDEHTSVTAVELVSVKIRPKGFRELVALVSEFKSLEQLRLTSSITDMNTHALVDAAVRASNLRKLALEHNDLEDDAFQGLTSVTRPISLRHLRLGNNALTASTLGAISNASLDGFLCLERLELTNNTEVCDAGVHALTPMLASGNGDSSVLTGLQHLDLRNCEFGVEGAMNLLLALGANRSLTHLNISQNFFGTSFGDILADFLLTNDTVRVLRADYVGLTDRGCTKRLCTALRRNRTLQIVSLGANRLRDAGACAVLQPIVERGKEKPFVRVDLGGNLLTRSGLEDMARIFERVGSSSGSRNDGEDDRPSSDDRRKRRRLSSDSNGKPRAAMVDSPRTRCSADDGVESKPVIDELSLLNNDFAGDSADVLAILRAHVGHLRSNEWTGTRNVYDDEV